MMHVSKIRKKLIKKIDSGEMITDEDIAYQNELSCTGWIRNII